MSPKTAIPAQSDHPAREPPDLDAKFSRETGEANSFFSSLAVGAFFPRPCEQTCRRGNRTTYSEAGPPGRVYILILEEQGNLACRRAEVNHATRAWRQICGHWAPPIVKMERYASGDIETKYKQNGQ